MVRAILGCLFMVTGAVFGAEQLFFNGDAFWAGALAVCAGMAVLLLLPGRRSPGAHDEQSCTTCRGAGTVYTAEYNDWRQTGPIKTIRELCPACDGLAGG